MRKYSTILLMALLAVGLLAGGAFAAYMEVQDPSGPATAGRDALVIPSTTAAGCVTAAAPANSHPMAVELYNPAVGTSTLSDDSLNAGTLYIVISNPVQSTDTVNLISTDTTVANFNSGGTGDLRYALVVEDTSGICWAPDGNVGIACRYDQYIGDVAVCDTVADAGNWATINQVVALSSPIASPTGNLAFDVLQYDLGGGEDYYYFDSALIDDPLTVGVDERCLDGIAPNTRFRVLQFTEPGVTYVDNLGTTYDLAAQGPTFYVSTNLGDTCSINNKIQIGFATPRDSTAVYCYAHFAQEFTSSLNQTAMDAVLDTSNDFELFDLLATNPAQTLTTTTLGPHLLFSMNQAPNVGWIVYADTLGNTTADFTIDTAAPEAWTTITVSSAGGSFNSNCTADSSNLFFTCDDVFLYDGDISIMATVGGLSGNQNLPTSWTMGTLTPNVGTTIQRLCVTVGGSIGIWTGGLEVFIPFVKSDPANGYETYIKLFNRYLADAQLYLSTFRDTVGDEVMVGLTQLSTMADHDGTIVDLSFIPADDFVTIRGSDIAEWLDGQTAFGGGTIDGIQTLVDGIPVKFQVLVPQQDQTGLTGRVIPEDGLPVDFAGSDAADFLNVRQQHNAEDPYIQGVVISVYPGGGQRAIPLMFKLYKNGSYLQ